MKGVNVMQTVIIVHNFCCFCFVMSLEHHGAIEIGIIIIIISSSSIQVNYGFFYAFIFAVLPPFSSVILM